MSRELKYECKACNERITKKYVSGYMDVGFSLHHIACPECGQQTIVENGGNNYENKRECGEGAGGT